MKLSRTTFTALVLAVTAVVLAAILFNRPEAESEGEAGDGRNEAKSGSSGSAMPTLPRKNQRTTVADRKALAVKELELLWARGRGQELLFELDRVSAVKDLDYWKEIGPLLIKQAAQEGRPEIAKYLLATSDASPDDNLRIGVYAAAMDNHDKEIQASARLELENITGEEFANGEAARIWLSANPQVIQDEEEEMPEDQ